jgi:CelD/BcsL family acetyltransferase involved in cellulose biosynthesis
MHAEYLSGALSVLYAGEQPVAAQFGLRAGSVIVGWFTGYDASYAKYSPGLIQLMRLAEGVATTGATTIHMGKGAAKYTHRVKTGDILVGQGTVTAQSVLGAAHRAHTVIARRALQSARQHPTLHDTADTILRRSGLSRRSYGRVLVRLPRQTSRPTPRRIGSGLSKVVNEPNISLYSTADVGFAWRRGLCLAWGMGAECG